jgi:hypothetical protein
MKAPLQTRFETPSLKFFSRIGMAAVLMLIASAPSGFAQIYNFTFSSGGMNATGTIDIVGGVAQSGSINVTGVPLEATPSTMITSAGSLLPASGPTDARDHDGDVITFDNVVLGSDPIFTGNGLGFGSGFYGYDGGTPEYDTIINLWGNSPGSYGLFVGEAQVDGSGNVIGDAQWVYAENNGSLTLTPSPEPSTVALMLGALTVGFVAIRRRRATA